MECSVAASRSSRRWTCECWGVLRERDDRWIQLGRGIPHQKERRKEETRKGRKEEKKKRRKEGQTERQKENFADQGKQHLCFQRKQTPGHLLLRNGAEPPLTFPFPHLAPPFACAGSAPDIAYGARAEPAESQSHIATRREPEPHSHTHCQYSRRSVSTGHGLARA
eukprot:3940847-Rhodomonas_salina.9